MLRRNDSCAAGNTTVFRWYGEFKKGNSVWRIIPVQIRLLHFSLEKNTAAVRNMLDQERRLDLPEDKVDLRYHPYTWSTRNSSRSYQSEKRLFSLCAPFINREQMTCGVVSPREVLKMFTNGTTYNINNIVTGDETWLCYYILTKA